MTHLMAIGSGAEDMGSGDLRMSPAERVKDKASQ